MFNARSIKNKLADLYEIIYTDNYDCIFITESWLNDTIPNSLLDPENRFHVIRDDRVERQGVGVCVLIAKTYSTVEIQLDKQDLLSNVVAVDLVLNGNKIRLITVCIDQHAGIRKV